MKFPPPNDWIKGRELGSKTLFFLDGKGDCSFKELCNLLNVFFFSGVVVSHGGVPLYFGKRQKVLGIVEEKKLRMEKEGLLCIKKPVESEASESL